MIEWYVNRYEAFYRKISIHYEICEKSIFPNNYIEPITNERSSFKTGHKLIKFNLF